MDSASFTHRDAGFGICVGKVVYVMNIRNVFFLEFSPFLILCRICLRGRLKQRLYILYILTVVGSLLCMLVNVFIIALVMD